MRRGAALEPDADVLRLQALGFDVCQSAWASVNLQGFHFFSPCNLANALAMAEPLAACGAAL